MTLKKDQTLLTGLFLVLNTLDMVLTLCLLATGLATEANPLLAWMLGVSKGLFVLFKLTVPTVGILYLLSIRSKTSLVAMVLVNLIYLGVVVNQLWVLNSVTQ